MKQFKGNIKFKNTHTFPSQIGGMYEYTVYPDIIYRIGLTTNSTRNTIYDIQATPSMKNDMKGLKEGVRWTPTNWLKNLFDKGEIEIVNNG